MILLWMSTALAVPVGPGQAYESILDALAKETTDPVSLELTQEYRVSAEGPFGSEVGIVVDRDLVLSSNVEGEPRKAPPMWIQGSTVILEDLEIAKTAHTYSDAGGGSQSSGSYNARLLIEQGKLTATRVVIQDAGATNRNAVLAYDSTVVLDQVQIQNGSYGDGERPESAYAVALVNDQGGGGSLTLNQTTITNLQGGGVYVDGQGTAQKLSFADLEIEQTLTTLPGSAIHTVGQSNVTGSDLWILGAGNTAVVLSEGNHSITGGVIQECEGGEGGLFHIQGGGELLVNALRIDNVLGETGGLAYLEPGARIELLDVLATNLSATEGAGVSGQEAQIEIRGGSYCGMLTRSGSVFDAGSDLEIRGAVFSGVPDTLLNAGGTTRLVNNTFVDVGVLLEGVLDRLEFTNNALVQVSTLSQGQGLLASALRFTFFDPTSEASLDGLDPGFGAVLADEPQFVDTFDPGLCGSEPIPAAGSPLINTGDPDMQDPDGSRSDIGALPGPSDGDQDPDPGEAPLEVHLSGGCGGGFQAAFLLLPLLGWRRRRDLVGA